MAVFPISLRDLMSEVNSAVSLMDQNFGLGLLDNDLIQPRTILAAMPRCGYVRPWRHLPGKTSGVSNVCIDKDGFKVHLDVQQFKPEEVLVKIVDDCVVVEGSHEERSDDHGFVSRQFKRRYVLPNDIDEDAISSNLSSDGVLTIQAPKKKPVTDKSERVIPISHTQAPAVKAAESTSFSPSKPVESTSFSPSTES